MRTINVQDTAKRLKISRSVVYSLVKKGVLHDIKPVVEGAKKHYAAFNSSEVTSLKAALHGRSGKITSKTAAAIKLALNGHTPVVAAPKPKNILDKVRADVEAMSDEQLKTELAKVQKPKPIEGINTRLDRIERKLDELLTMWR